MLTLAVLMYSSLLPVGTTPWLPVSTTSSTTPMYDVVPLDMSIQRVEVDCRQTADGGRVTAE